MKLKKVTMEVVLELPANVDPRSKIFINAYSEAYKLHPIKIIKEDDLGEVILPWQKAAHARNTIRGLVIKLLKEMKIPFTARVYGDNPYNLDLLSNEKFRNDILNYPKISNRLNYKVNRNYEVEDENIYQIRSYRSRVKICSLADPNLTGLRKEFQKIKNCIEKYTTWYEEKQ